MRPPASLALAACALAACLLAPVPSTAQIVPETSGKPSAAASSAARVKTGSQRRVERPRRAPPPGSAQHRRR